MRIGRSPLGNPLVCNGFHVRSLPSSSLTTPERTEDFAAGQAVKMAQFLTATDTAPKILPPAAVPLLPGLVQPWYSLAIQADIQPSMSAGGCDDAET